MPDDHSVYIAGSNPATELFPVFLLKIFFCCHQNIGRRIELQPFSGKLLDDVVRHHDHRFITQTKPFTFHSRRYHCISFSFPYHIGQQSIPAIDNPGHSVLLVFPQRNLRVHAIEMQVAPVILPWPDSVESFIIICGQPLPALRIFPDPFLECLLNQVLFSLCNGGFLFIQNRLSLAFLVLHIIKHTGIPQI